MFTFRHARNKRVAITFFIYSAVQYNNNSLITTVTYRDCRMLFLGDAMKKRLEEFEGVMEERYDLIKLPHHGDSNKPLLRILKAARPAWAVEMVSAAEIVEPELLQRLQELNVTLFRTSDGPVHAEWTEEGLTVGGE